MKLHLRKILILAIFGLLSTLAVVRAEEIVKEFDSNGIRELEIETETAQVEITGKAGAKFIIKLEFVSPSNQCEANFKQSSKTLLVEVESTKLFKNCKAKIFVEGPSQIDVSLRTGSGNATLKNMEGKLHSRAGSGDLTADGKFSKLDVLRGSGKISVRGLERSAEVKTGSGDIELEFLKTARDGEIEIKSGSANSTIILPKDATVELKHRSPSGEFESDFPIAAKGSFEVSVMSGSGDLKIKKAK